VPAQERKVVQGLMFDSSFVYNKQLDSVLPSSIMIALIGLEGLRLGTLVKIAGSKIHRLNKEKRKTMQAVKSTG
jgi:hypothetical protein